MKVIYRIEQEEKQPEICLRDLTIGNVFRYLDKSGSKYTYLMVTDDGVTILSSDLWSAGQTYSGRYDAPVELQDAKLQITS